MGVQGALEIANGLKSNRGLESLYLNNCALQDEGGCHIFNALGKYTR